MCAISTGISLLRGRGLVYRCKQCNQCGNGSIKTLSRIISGSIAPLLLSQGRAWASGAVARSAGEGDSFSSSTEKWRIHSNQSSTVERWLDSQARRRLASPTASRSTGRAAGSGGT